MSETARDAHERFLQARPEGLGKKVTAIAYARHGRLKDWLKKDYPQAQARFQNDAENTFLFVGGEDVALDWTKQQATKNFVGLFEENLRWRWSLRNDVAGDYSTLSRFCIISARNGDKLADVVNDFHERVGKLDPQNVVYVVGREDIENPHGSVRDYVATLTQFIQQVLGLRNNTGTLQIIKHWPAAPTYVKAAAFNEALSLYSKAVNYALNYVAQMHPEWAERILLVDGEHDSLFSAAIGVKNGYYAADGISLSRAGHDRVAQELGKAGWPQMYQEGEDTPPSEFADGPGWSNYAHTHLRARPVPFAYTGLRRGGSLNVMVAPSKTDRRLRTLIVRVPEGQANQKVTWMLRFADAGVHYSGSATLDYNGVFVIADLGTFNASVISPFTHKYYTNDYVLTVFDDAGRHYDVYEGLDLASGTTQAKLTRLSPLQARFMKLISDRDRALTWVFIGDSTDHGARAVQGFDVSTEIIAKNMQADWGRTNDFFINAAMSGDFTNRAVDPVLLRARIVKYRPDIFSITLGINDGVNKTFAGVQNTYADEKTFKANMRKLVQTAKYANPGVIVVVNAVAPCNFENADGSRREFPATYNQWLKELFGAHGEPEFSSYVLFNDAVYEQLQAMLTAYPSMYHDGLFYFQDGLHPGPNAHLIKARTILSTLGINLNNTYLGAYLLTERPGVAGLEFDSLRFQVLASTSVQARSGRTVVPDLVSWAQKVTEANVGVAKAELAQVFLTLVNPEGRAYALETPEGETVKNRHAFPYLPAGQYSVIIWAGLKHAWADGHDYLVKAPVQANGLLLR